MQEFEVFSAFIPNISTPELENMFLDGEKREDCGRYQYVQTKGPTRYDKLCLSGWGTSVLAIEGMEDESTEYLHLSIPTTWTTKPSDINRGTSQIHTQVEYQWTEEARGQ